MQREARINLTAARLKALPDALPDIRLRHGEALWLLDQLGFRGNATPCTFKEYVKSLRKLGIPFDRGQIRRAERNLAIYSYDRLMELALGLTLRVYHVVPDSILVELVRLRKRLDRIYRIAYAERSSRRGSPLVIEVPGQRPIRMRGVFLDLQINFSGGHLVSFGPPRLLAPFEAVTTFATRNLAARAFLPIALSLLSERLVALALCAPPVRSGPRKQDSATEAAGPEERAR